MKAWKYSGIYLWVTGILHTAVALFVMSDIYWAMLKDGLGNSIGGDVARNTALWFMVCGVLLIMFGLTLQYYIRKENSPAPRSLGCFMLTFCVVGCIIEPLSGFWLFIPQALIIIFAKRK